MTQKETIPLDPLEGYCLCDAPGHETTESGIVIPESQINDQDKTPIKLHVLKVGPGELMDGGKRREVVIEPGGYYYFLFPSYSLGATLTLQGKKLVLVQARFVCGRAT
jgi:co-chaperonin GroES (HSP10)